MNSINLLFGFKAVSNIWYMFRLFMCGQFDSKDCKTVDKKIFDISNTNYDSKNLFTTKYCVQWFGSMNLRAFAFGQDPNSLFYGECVICCYVVTLDALRITAWGIDMYSLITFNKHQQVYLTLVRHGKVHIVDSVHHLCKRLVSFATIRAIMRVDEYWYDRLKVNEFIFRPKHTKKTHTHRQQQTEQELLSQVSGAATRKKFHINDSMEVESVMRMKSINNHFLLDFVVIAN